jgi:hypothetical protein
VSKVNISVESKNLELLHRIISTQYKNIKEEILTLQNKKTLVEFEIEKGLRENDELLIQGLYEQLSLAYQKHYVAGNTLDQIEQIWEEE